MNEPARRGASRRVARNAAARTIGEVGAKLASVAFFVVMARELGSSGFGDFMFALSLTTVLVLASGFGTEDLVAREVSRDHSRVHDYLSNVLAIKVPTSFALVLVAWLVVLVLGYPADVQAAVVLVGAGVAFENLGRTWGSIFNAFERQEFFAVSLIVQRTSTALVGIFLLVNGAGLVPAAAVFCGGAVLAYVVGTITLRRFVVKPELRIDRSRWLPIVKAGIPIGMITILFQALLKLDQTLLGFLGGDDNRQVGYYAAAMRLIEATMFIPWSFSSAMLPWFSVEQGAAKLARGYELGLKVMASVLLPIGIGMAALAAPIVTTLYGHHFEPAVVPLRYLGVMCVLYGFNNLAASVMVARDRPNEFSRLLVVVTVLNIGSNLVLIPIYGASGAAFAAVLSSGVLAVLSVQKVSRLTGSVSLKRVFLGPVISGAVMAAVLLFIDLPLIPVAVLGGLCYLAVLVAFERLVHPEDFAFVTSALPSLGGRSWRRGERVPSVGS
jgi:O-antigen/teichoic acid export membrane protein